MIEEKQEICFRDSNSMAAQFSHLNEETVFDQHCLTHNYRSHCRTMVKRLNANDELDLGANGI